MIPNAQVREVESKGVTATSEFGISMKDAAHIMTILRDTLYSDKVLAVLREYSANAWDAHREVGKHAVPIKVTLPTTMDPTLTIQDFGPGLSHEDVFEVYTQYGASTKRDNDNAVGMLGIGSKSAFAYADSFTITSKHGGKQRTYVAVLDESEKGAINLLDEVDCDPSETGVSIQVAIQPKDIWEFTTKARKLYEYFLPRPEVNTDLPAPQPVKSALSNGVLFENNTREWTAIMGCVPYRINVEQIVGVLTDKNEGVGEYINRISGVLYFNIGEVQVNASREELKYSTNTKHALIRRFNLLVEEFVDRTIKDINAGNLTPFEKRLRAQVLNHMHLPIPDACKGLTEDYVKFKKEPKTFKVTRDGGVVSGLTIKDGTRLLIRDDIRSIKGFNLDTTDYIVQKLDDTVTLKEVQDELEKILKATGLDGLPTVLTSTLSWYVPPAPQYSKKGSKKHQVKTFILNPKSSFCHPWSDHWEIVDREPTKDDVFVIFSGFRTEPEMSYDIYNMYRQDEFLAKHFGGTMPTIYGYKSTEKRPVFAKDCLGTDYGTWREGFVQSLVTPKVLKLLNYYEWSRMSVTGYYERHPSKVSVEGLKKELGASHPIYKLFKRQQDGLRITRGTRKDHNKEQAIQALKKRIFSEDDDAKNKSEAELAKEEIYDTYPLLRIANENLGCLYGTCKKEWLEYVQLVDKFKEKP